MSSRSMPNYTPEVLVSLCFTLIWFIARGTVMSWLELVIGHPVKGSSWPREHRLTLCTYALHMSRRGWTQTGATVSSYKGQSLKREHLLELGCFVRNAVQPEIRFTSWVSSVLCLVNNLSEEILLLQK